MGVFLCGSAWGVGGVGGMGRRSFDGRVGCDKFAVGVGSFLARAHVARDRRGIGEFGAA